MKPKTMQVRYKSGLRQIEYLNTVPAGWVKLEGATTAPKGFSWYGNKKSLFSKNYKQQLIKTQ